MCQYVTCLPWNAISCILNVWQVAAQHTISQRSPSTKIARLDTGSRRTGEDAWQLLSRTIASQVLHQLARASPAREHRMICLGSRVKKQVSIPRQRDMLRRATAKESWRRASMRRVNPTGQRREIGSVEAASIAPPRMCIRCMNMVLDKPIGEAWSWVLSGVFLQCYIHRTSAMISSVSIIFT